MQIIRKYLKYALLTIIVIDVVLLTLFSAFYLASFDFKFYSKQYEQNGVYEQFGKEKINRITGELFAYLNGRGELDSRFFNRKELEHLKDVQKLFRTVKMIYFGLIIVLPISLLFFYKQNNAIIKKTVHILSTSSILILLAVLTMFGLSSDFENYFYRFHEMFFNNNNWMLDPATDNLIVMFPENFFLAIVAKISVYWLLSAVFLLVVSVTIFFFLNKPNEKPAR